MANTQDDVLKRRLLGQGLALEAVDALGRDLVLAADGSDLTFVDGPDNLSQGLAVAVLTPLGADVFNTGFGFDGLTALSQETSPLLLRERVRVSIVKLLTNDPRVQRVVDVRLVDERLDSPSTPQRVLQVSVAFQAITGDQLTLSAANAGTRWTDG